MVFPMTVSILVCGCGLEVWARGRISRPRGPYAPGAAASSPVPDSLPPEQLVPASTIDSPGPAHGYGLKPAKGYSPRKKRGRGGTPPTSRPLARVSSGKESDLPMAGGILPASEKNRIIVVRQHPVSAPIADSLAVIASLTAILWLFTILVPEYCLDLMGDADKWVRRLSENCSA